ncbi:MAG: Gfo/Idh/MocA family oxidoreductase [Phycisphaerae bacterium]|nr:Gfo/Idh/MocA family oxidoreductase [Phycisphaerae bacterium]
MAIKIGVIGCGYWGPNIIRNFSEIDSTQMSYICDLNRSRLETISKSYPAAKITDNYQDILNDKDIDAVVITTPVDAHYTLAKESLLAGKHVLIEKPMVGSVAEAEELVRIAEQNNKVLMVDHTFEYAQPINEIKKVVDDGKLGDIYYIRAEWLNLGLLQPDVNVIWDLATHIFSIVSYVSGMNPISLNADAGAYVRKDIPEIAHVHVKYPNNITAYMTVSWLEPKKTRRLTIIGSKKTLIYDLINVEEPIKIYDTGVDLANPSGDINQLRVNYRYGDILSPHVKNIEPLRKMCSHFADCIIDGTTPISDGRSGLNVVKMLEATEDSLKNNGMEIKL